MWTRTPMIRANTRMMKKSWRISRCTGDAASAAATVGATARIARRGTRTARIRRPERRTADAKRVPIKYLPSFP